MDDIGLFINLLVFWSKPRILREYLFAGKSYFEVADEALYFSFISFNILVGIGFYDAGVVPVLMKANFIFAGLFFFLRFSLIKHMTMDLVVLASWILFILIFQIGFAAITYGILIYACYLASLRRYNFSTHNALNIALIVLICQLMQMMVFQFQDTYVSFRPTLASKNPNFASMQIFLLVLLSSQFFSNWVTPILSLQGLFLKSRSYILSMFTFLLLRNKFAQKFINRLPLMFVWAFSILLVIGVGEVVLWFVHNYGLTAKGSGYFGKFTSIFDESNWHRFLANSHFYHYILNDSQAWVGLKNYSNVARYFEQFKIESVPHNSTFKIVAIYGLGSICYFYFMLKLFNEIAKEKRAEVISWLVYSMFLMRCFDHHYLAMFTAACLFSSKDEV